MRTFDIPMSVIPRVVRPLQHDGTHFSLAVRFTVIVFCDLARRAIRGLSLMLTEACV